MKLLLTTTCLLLYSLLPLSAQDNRDVFAEGKAQYQQGAYYEACQHFSAAYTLSKHSGDASYQDSSRIWIQKSVAAIRVEQQRTGSLQQATRELYERFMTEARSMEQQRNYEEAITRYELAAEFARDSATVKKAIADCQADRERGQKFEELLAAAAEAEARENYGQAVDQYAQANELVGLRPELRERVISFKNRVSEEARKAGENANALSYDPERAGKYRQNARRFNALANRLNEILQQKAEK